MITEIRSWRTVDGKVFESEEEAKMHAGALAVREWVREMGICRGGNWTAQMVADAILECPASLYNSLTAYLRREIP